jgi:hypothetical protein
MRLGLIDEFRLDLHPYVAGECTPVVRRRRQVLPARPGLQQRVPQRDRRAALSPAPLTSGRHTRRVAIRRALSRQRNRLSLDPRRQVRIVCGRGHLFLHGRWSIDAAATALGEKRSWDSWRGRKQKRRAQPPCPVHLVPCERERGTGPHARSAGNAEVSALTRVLAGARADAAAMFTVVSPHEDGTWGRPGACVESSHALSN